MDCSPPGSSVHGISQARIMRWLPFPSPGNLLYPGIGPRSPALQADSLPIKPPGTVALRIFSCCMWNLVPWPRIKLEPPALGAWSLSHWTAREVPRHLRYVRRQPHQEPQWKTPRRTEVRRQAQSSWQLSHPFQLYKMSKVSVTWLLLEAWYKFRDTCLLGEGIVEKRNYSEWRQLGRGSGTDGKWARHGWVDWRGWLWGWR